MDEYDYSVQWSLYETGSMWTENWTDFEHAQRLYHGMKEDSGWTRLKLVRRRKVGPVEVVKED